MTMTGGVEGVAGLYHIYIYICVCVCVCVCVSVLSYQSTGAKGSPATDQLLDQSENLSPLWGAAAAARQGIVRNVWHGTASLWQGMGWYWELKKPIYKRAVWPKPWLIDDDREFCRPYIGDYNNPTGKSCSNGSKMVELYMYINYDIYIYNIYDIYYDIYIWYIYIYMIYIYDIYMIYIYIYISYIYIYIYIHMIYIRYISYIWYMGFKWLKNPSIVVVKNNTVKPHV